ncbi:ATP-dependent zinc protease family protein [Alloalcanivorax marinus]|uniref:retropepsin-like aspartic peptidase RloA3 n=1 Tax=Alloalcanivorax marinus TaxID=1177169 RepID=UPI0019326633|nr:ATP-dependent zinc protease [Alloalcanivorax marinus]MBL7251126.1 ATP-dependent zinc protease [Alloalcanivorax marinus]
MRRILIVMGLLFSVTATAATTEIQHVFGWVENATLEPMGARVKAKLDTGALTSSLHAVNVERFEKDGEEWVRFKVKVEDQKDKEVVSETFERPVYRDLTVRGAGGRDDRPVVLMKICFGDTVYEEQFGLNNRSDMIYPVLIGRRTIQHLGVVDVTSTFLHEPDCDENSPVRKFDKDNTDEDIGA